MNKCTHYRHNVATSGEVTVPDYTYVDDSDKNLMFSVRHSITLDLAKALISKHAHPMILSQIIRPNCKWTRTVLVKAESCGPSWQADSTAHHNGPYNCWPLFHDLLSPSYVDRSVLSGITGHISLQTAMTDNFYKHVCIYIFARLFLMMFIESYPSCISESVRDSSWSPLSAYMWPRCDPLLLARLVGQHCFACWRLSSLSVEVCNTPRWALHAALRAQARRWRHAASSLIIAPR